MSSIRSKRNHAAFMAEFNAQEAAKADALLEPVRKAEQESKRIADIEKSRIRLQIEIYPDEGLTGVTPYAPSSNPVENEIENIKGRIATAKRTFLEQIKGEYNLTDACIEYIDGYMRLNKGRVDLTQSSNWVACLSRLISLDAFDLSVIKMQKPVTAPTKTAPSFDEILNSTDGTTREGAKKLRDIAEQEGGQEYFPIFQQWLTSLADNFSFYPTQAQKQAAVRHMQRMNYSFSYGPHYDATRVALWGLRTADEALAERIENSQILSNPSARREFAAESYKLREGL
jgi:hypothetical protein